MKFGPSKGQEAIGSFAPNHLGSIRRATVGCALLLCTVTVETIICHETSEIRSGNQQVYHLEQAITSALTFSQFIAGLQNIAYSYV